MNKSKILFTLLSIVILSGSFASAENAFAVASDVTLQAPSASTSINGGASVDFTWIGGDASDGTITFTHSAGDADGNSPHIYNLSGSEFTQGPVSVTLATLLGDGTFTTGGTLVNGATYTVEVASAGDGVSDTAGSVTYDTTPASAPSTPDLDAGSDSGSSDTDDITNDTTPTITGTGEIGATLEIFVDASTDGTTTVDSSGDWSITLSALTPGASYDITAAQTDVAGNTQSSASSALSVTIDTADPTITSVTPAGSTSIASGFSVGFTNSEAIASGTIVFTLTSGTDGSAPHSYTMQSADFASGAQSITQTILETDGSFDSLVDSAVYTMTVDTTDVAGNTATTVTNTLIAYDTSGPSAPSTPDLDAGSDSGSSDTDDITNVTTPTITGTGEIGATLEIFVDASTDGTTTVDSSGDWSITLSALTPGASYDITAAQTDTAGNPQSSASSALSVTIDTTDPTLGTVTPAGSTSIASGFSVDFTNSKTIASGTIVFSLTSGTDGSAPHSYTMQSADFASGAQSITESTLGTALVDGAIYTMTVDTTDVAGNTATTVTNALITYDTTPSTPPGTPDLVTASDTGSSNSDDITNDTTPSFTGTGAEVGATVELFVSGVSQGTDTADGSGNWAITSSALTDATYTVTARQTDTAGNAQSADSSGLSVTIDTTAPTMDSVTAITTATADVTFSEDIDDGSVSDTADFTVDGTATTGASASGSVVTLTVSTTLVVGTSPNVILLSTASGVTDLAGNTLASAGLTTLTDAAPLAIDSTTLITNIDASASTTPSIQFTGQSTPSTPIEIITPNSVATVTLPAGATINGGGVNPLIEMSVSTTTITEGLPSGVTTGTVIELGDPNNTLTFTVAVKVVLTGQAGNNPFYIAQGTTTATPILGCSATYADGAAALADPILTADSPTSTCYYNEGADMIIWTTHFTGFGSYSSSSNNGGGCGDCEPPTLGLDSNYRKMVDNGFTYNGKSVDAERFFTPYPLITVNIGELNTAVFKIYENQGIQNIKHISFAFGLANDDIISNSKAMIELNIDYDGTETVTVYDPQNALDDIKVTTDVVDCQAGSTAQCLEVTMEHMFRAPLDFNIVATDVWDQKRNAWQNYFNHGIEVIGESMNPPEEYNANNRGQIYHLTETGKTTAVDEFGNNWSLKYDVWMMDYIKSEKPKDNATEIMTRHHSEFAEYKKSQIIDAIDELVLICQTCLDESFAGFDDSFAYDIPTILEKLQDPLVQEKLALESQRAQEIMDNITRLSDRSADNNSQYAEKGDYDTYLKEKQVPIYTETAFVTTALKNNVLMISGDIAQGDKNIQVSLYIDYNDNTARHYYIPVMNDGSFYFNVLAESIKKVTITHDGVPLE